MSRFPAKNRMSKSKKFVTPYERFLDLEWEQNIEDGEDEPSVYNRSDMLSFAEQYFKRHSEIKETL